MLILINLTDSSTTNNEEETTRSRLLDEFGDPEPSTSAAANALDINTMIIYFCTDCDCELYTEREAHTHAY